MGPLGAVDGIGTGFHPAEGTGSEGAAAGGGEVLGEGVAAGFPLGAAGGGLGEADGAPLAGGDVNEVETVVGVVGIAQDEGPGAVGGDVPGVAGADGAMGAGGPIHGAEGLGPDGVDEMAGTAEEGFVDDELVVGMEVEAFQARAVAADAVHAGGGVAGKLDPFGFGGVELGMDDGAGEGDEGPVGAIGAADGEAGLGSLFDGGDEPFAGGIEGGFAHGACAEIGEAGLLEGDQVEDPEGSGADEEDTAAVRVDGGGEGVDGSGGGELADGAGGVGRDGEELPGAGTIGDEKEGVAVGGEGALQEISGVADGGGVGGQLQDLDAGEGIGMALEFGGEEQAFTHEDFFFRKRICSERSSQSAPATAVTRAGTRRAGSRTGSTAGARRKIGSWSGKLLIIASLHSIRVSTPPLWAARWGGSGLFVFDARGKG